MDLEKTCAHCGQIWSVTKNIGQAQKALICFISGHHVVTEKEAEALRDVVAPALEPWFRVRCTKMGLCLIGPFEYEWQATSDVPQDQKVEYFTHLHGFPWGAELEKFVSTEPEGLWKIYLLPWGDGWKVLRKVRIQ